MSDARPLAEPHACNGVPPTRRRRRAALERTWRDPPGLARLALRRSTTRRSARASSSPRSASSSPAACSPRAMRLQLARPDNTLVGPDLYNQLFTMHGTTMMFLFAVPVMQAMAVYLVPLMVGTRSIAFPRMNAYAYWVYPVRRADAVRRASSLNIGPDAGWFAYVPLAGPDYSPGKRADFWAQMITFTELSGLLEAVDHHHDGLQAARAGHDARTACRCSSGRCSSPRSWCMFAMPSVMLGEHGADHRPAGRHALLQPGRRRRRAALAAPVLVLRPPRGLPHLHPGARLHVVDHPDVRAPADLRLPGDGAVADRDRRSSSFGLWVHHMFATNVPELGKSFFTAASMMIAIPTAVQIFCWIATLWTGRLNFKTPLLFVLGFFFILVLGGLTGLMLGVGAARPAGARHLLRRRAPALRADRRRRVPAVRRVLLLVPEDHRPHAERARSGAGTSGCSSSASTSRSSRCTCSACRACRGASTPIRPSMGWGALNLARDASAR